MSAPTVKAGKLADFTPDPRNANNGTMRGAIQVEESLRRNGAGRSILVSSDGVILAGNKTSEQAGQIGLDDVILVQSDGTKLVAVQRTDLHSSDPRARALAVADNRTSEVGLEWDAAELAALANEGIDLDVYFRQDELDALMMAGAEGDADAPTKDIPGRATEPDAPNDVPARANPGDVWRMGMQRLHVCDCRSLPIPEESNVVVFDPPFNWADVYDWIPANREGVNLLVFTDAFRLADAVVAATARGWTFAYEFVWDGLSSWFTPGRPLARHKVALVFGEKWNFDAAVYTPVGSDGEVNDVRQAGTVSNTRGSYTYTPDPRGKHLSTVFPYANTRVEGDHKHAKPAEWVRALLRGMGASQIFDMCAGSGTVACVAEGEGWGCVSCEIDPATADILLARWEVASGGVAVREVVGEHSSTPPDNHESDPRRYDRSKFYRSKSWRALRQSVLQRDANTCAHCGIHTKQGSAHIDHIVSRNAGGTDTLDNLQTLCHQCHSKKTARAT